MKIKLIGPTRYLENGKLLKSKKLMVPSLTFPLLAALTPPDIDVSTVNEICEDINFGEKVDLVGITSYTINIHRAYQIADEFKKRNVPVVMGGIHVSMEPEEAKQHADTIIIGEAEETWPQFINDFRNGKRKKVYKAEKRPSLANLPIPRFSLINKSHYVDYQLIPIQTARGCPHSCDFCSVTKFSGRRYRTRPISDVINEIKTLGAKICFFIDDNIFASHSRTRELLKALIPLRILWFGQATISAANDRELIELAQKSGCIELSIGLESLSRKNLESVGKTINIVEHYEKNLKTYRKAGIRVAASMIFGFDDDESGVFKETYHFLMKNRLPYTYWTALCPYPETPLYKRLKDQGRLKDAK
ncbi:B12-binding domain-containing radical SAM protein, partial [Candidatus Aerophobetes bacterium]|nr:B12-binding domain-containing radical SAM protein [Candidatus Aerophobetes bacterium]